MIVSNHFDGKAEADGGVAERHESSDEGKYGELMEVWDLTQNHLDQSKQNDEFVVGHGAVVLVAVFVEAQGFLHRTNYTRHDTTSRQSPQYHSVCL